MSNSSHKFSHGIQVMYSSTPLIFIYLSFEFYLIFLFLQCDWKPHLLYRKILFIQDVDYIKNQRCCPKVDIWFHKSVLDYAISIQ